MPVDDKTVLRAAHEALTQEINRIKFLITPTADHPLGDYAHRIQTSFGSLSEARNTLDQIKEAVAGRRSSQEGWRAS